MSKPQPEGHITAQEETDKWPRAQTESPSAKLKKARQEFRQLSRGELELLSDVYYGDGHRHHIYHEVCGGHSWISLEELRSLAPNEFCPHCHGTDDLSRFGSLENLQYTACRASGYNAYFFGINPLGHSGQEYTYWCSRHRCSYTATFKAFWEKAGETNACPHCAEAAKGVAD